MIVQKDSPIHKALSGHHRSDEIAIMCETVVQKSTNWGADGK
jgi:hypothetical protein